MRLLRVILASVATLVAFVPYGRSDQPTFVRLGDRPARAVAVAGDTVVVAHGKRITLYSADGRAVRDFVGHSHTVEHLAFSPDGDTLASAAESGDYGPLRFWDVATGALIRKWGDGRRCVRGIAFAPDGQTLAVLEPDAITLHNPRLGRFSAELPIPRGWTDLAHIALSRDGRTLAVGCEKARWARFDVSARTLVARATAPGPCLGLHFLADKRMLWVDSYDLHLCGSDDGTSPPFAGQSLCNATALALCPAGDRLAVARGEEVTLWNVAQRREVARFRGPRGDVKALAFLSATKLVAAGEGGAVVWTIPSGGAS